MLALPDMEFGIGDGTADHLAVPAMSGLCDAIFVITRRRDASRHGFRRGWHANDDRWPRYRVELEHRLLVIVPMQHELRAGLLQHA